MNNLNSRLLYSLFWTSCLLIFGLGNLVAQLQINGYHNAVIPDLEGGDIERVGETIRNTARKGGLITFTALGNVPETERMKTCVFTYAIYWWGAPDVGAKLSIRVIDSATGQQIASGDGNGWTSFTRKGNLNSAVNKAWRDLSYKGFDLKANAANIAKLRTSDLPIIDFDEEKFRARTNFAPVEGIWATPDNAYSILITKDTAHEHGDFIGIVLRATNPFWKRGELKIKLNEGATPEVLIGDYYDVLKRKVGTSFLVKDNIQLETTVHSEKITFVRLFPKTTTRGAIAPNEAGKQGSGVSFSGTGFIVSEDGYVITNHHVIEGASTVSASFPMAGITLPAKVVLKDTRNDLAVIKIQDFALAKLKLEKVPYRLSKTQTVALGDHVSTIGFPLEDVLGENPKYSEGTISSKSGIDDDLSRFQISTPVQPGNSGGPLFDQSRANIVGVIVARIRDDYVYKNSGSLPQNINYAIKGDYVINLLEMLPEPPRYSIVKTDSPTVDELARCVVLIRASR